MFRFIHAADPHLDSPLHGLEEYEGAPIEALRGATRRAFENLVNLAIDESVAFVVIAGDLYDGDWKDYSTGIFFRRQMVRLNARQIPVYLIAGNHDAASVISKKLSLPENVHVFSTRTAESKEVPGYPVVIHGRGFPNRAVPENLAREYPEAVGGKLNLGLLHTSLSGTSRHDTYAPCTELDLREKGYEYWALGHVHQPEVIGKDPWIVYAGNCQGRHVNEAGPRGCRLVTVNGSLQIECVEWCSLDVVRWHVLEVDLDRVDVESEALRRMSVAMGQAVANAEGRMLAARIVLRGATALHGSLHKESQRWRAEVMARGQDLGSQVFWLERLQVKTSPTYDLRQLADRDILTKSVLETIEDSARVLSVLPVDLEEMLGVLPSELRRDVEAEFAGDRRTALMEEVRTIILESLGNRGGNPG